MEIVVKYVHEKTIHILVQKGGKVKEKKKNFMLLCLVLPVLLNLVSIPGSTKVRGNDGLPPDILPVIILSGSDYEMGYQYGQQAGPYLAINKEASWASALEDFSRAEIIRALKANQYYIKKYTPEVIELMKGMADGASASGFTLSYTDVLLMNCTLPKPKTAVFPAGAEKDTLPPKKCSVCSAWGSCTSDGRLIGVDTLDASGDALYGVIILAFPDQGNNYICGAEAGEIGDHFFNE